MEKNIEVIAMVSDPRKIEAMKNKPGIFEITMTRSGSAAVTLFSENGIRYEVPPLLCNESFRIRADEGKSPEGIVSIICSVNGFPIRPFWIKTRKNQRDADQYVDARFSLDREFCFVTVNKLGLLVVTKVSMEDRLGYIEVKVRELFSTVLKRNGGKFLFSENMFPSRSPLACFGDPVKAAIRKANSSDGGGPLYCKQDDPAEVVRKGTASSTLNVLRAGNTIVLRGGMSMVSTQETS